jgi:hypothetical protein
MIGHYFAGENAIKILFPINAIPVSAPPPYIVAILKEP